MERVDEALDARVDILEDVWEVLAPMECAIAIHLMGGRTKKQIRQHFEISIWEMKLYVRKIRRKMLAHLPAP